MICPVNVRLVVPGGGICVHKGAGVALWNTAKIKKEPQSRKTPMYLLTKEGIPVYLYIGGIGILAIDTTAHLRSNRKKAQ